MKWTPIFVICLGAAACATGAGRERSFDDDDGEAPSHEVDAPRDDDAPAAVSSAPKEEEPLPDAASFRTAQLCSEAARALEKRGPASGWAMMERCTARDDFIDIYGLLAYPWIAKLGKEERGRSMLARVIARRSSRMEIDIALARDKGVPFFTVDEVLKSKADAPRLVLFRGRVIENPADPTTLRIAALHYDTKASRYSSYGRRNTSSFTWVESGAFIDAKLGASVRARLTPDVDRTFFMRLDPRGDGEILEHFDVGPN